MGKFWKWPIKYRKAYVCDRLELLDDLAGLPEIKVVEMVEASKEKNGKVQQEIRFYISSLAADAPTFKHLVSIIKALKIISTACCM